jgi:hypothetical protein
MQEVVLNGVTKQSSPVYPINNIFRFTYENHTTILESYKCSFQPHKSN